MLKIFLKGTLETSKVNDPVPYTSVCTARLAQFCSRDSGKLAIDHLYPIALSMGFPSIFWIWKRKGILYDCTHAQKLIIARDRMCTCTWHRATPFAHKWACTCNHTKQQVKYTGARWGGWTWNANRDLNTSTSEQYKLPYLSREENQASWRLYWLTERELPAKRE
jgi:hypothetical protein